MTTRRVYRATAHYDGPRPNTIVRHFLTKRARDDWARRRRDGYPATPAAFDDDRGPIPPASRVDVADSNPVTFPEDDTP